MVDLPESMKTGGFDPQKAAAQLEAEKNLSRMQRQTLQAPLQMPNTGRGVGPTPASAASNQAVGQPNIGAGAVVGAQAPGQQAKPGSYAARRQAAKARQAQRKTEGKDGQSKDYPNPINLRGFIAFGVIALFQDAAPLASDLLGIGWILEYILLPITWIAYWYLIIRRAPRSMKKKFWQRTILVTCVGWIPVIGQFIPEWIATAIGAYIVIASYQRKVAYEMAGRESQKSKNTKTAQPAVTA